jgi:hypothetical protein
LKTPLAMASRRFTACSSLAIQVPAPTALPAGIIFHEAGDNLKFMLFICCQGVGAFQNILGTG